MRSLVAFASLIAIATISNANPLQQASGRCNADDCARVVTGTRAGLPSTRLADCSSFMHVTVTPAPVYSTVTVVSVETETSTITTNPVFEYTTVTDTVYSVVRPTLTSSSSDYNYRRDVTAAGPTTVAPTAVPSYAASSCAPASESRYSSACSCAGVTRSTTTVAAPTYTVTKTVSETTEIFVAASTTIEEVVTQTQVAVKTGYPCGASVAGNGIYTFRNYGITCGQRVANNATVAQTGFDSNESECLRECNSVKYCVYANYQFSSGLCNIYYNEPPTQFVYEAGWDGLSLLN